MGPSVIGFKTKPPHVTTQLNLQCVVAGEKTVRSYILIGKTRESTGLGKRVGRIRVKRRETNPSLHVRSFVSGVIDREDSIRRYFLLNAKQPIGGIRIFGILW